MNKKQATSDKFKLAFKYSLRIGELKEIIADKLGPKILGDFFFCPDLSNPENQKIIVLPSRGYYLDQNSKPHPLRSKVWAIVRIFESLGYEDAKEYLEGEAGNKLIETKAKA